MVRASSIVIIGAGLIGLCTAHAFLERGANVTVIEARSGPCQGTSFSNSGMIHPSQAMSWDVAKPSAAEVDGARVTAELAKISRLHLLDLMRRLAVSVNYTGCVKIYKNMKAAQSAQAQYNKIGIHSNVVVNEKLSFSQPACQFPEDSSGDAYAFGCALAADLEDNGVTFIYEATDVDFRKTPTGFAIRASDKTFKADHLILAAGIATPNLLARSHIRMILKTVSGAAADFDLPAAVDKLPDGPIMDSLSHSAMTVFEDRLRISGGWNVTDPSDLIRRWHQIAPDVMDKLGPPRSSWTGIRPVSPVGRPYISPTSIENLWVNTGHGHMGWTLCAGSGVLLAEMVLDGRVDRRFHFSG